MQEHLAEKKFVTTANKAIVAERVNLLWLTLFHCTSIFTDYFFKLFLIFYEKRFIGNAALKFKVIIKNLFERIILRDSAP